MNERPEVKKIKNIFSKAKISSIIYDIDTSKLSSMRVGNKASCLIEAADDKELIEAVGACIKSKARFKVIGDGTNIIFSEDPMNIVLIKLGLGFKYLEFKSGNRISVGAAYRHFRFVVKAAGRGYDFSILSGIPGTVGGSIAGNSGNGEAGVCDFIENIEYISGESGTLKKKTGALDKTSFGYRYFKVPDLVAITGITLKTERGDSLAILEKIREKIRDRKISQPGQTNNSGCFFKNPEGSDLSAGQLIDRCGLKGFTFGGARVSEQHANFIENYDKARSNDVVVLSRIIRDMVMRKFKIDLKYEVEMIGP